MAETNTLSSQSPRQILVVGLNRSGTKWLSNILANHPSVAAIAAPQHFGILESNILGDFGRIFPQFSREDDYAAFCSMWAETDFVRLAQVSLVDLLSWKPRPRTARQALIRLLDEFAMKSAKSHWLQKCNPSAAHELLSDVNADCKVIIIARKFNSILESSLTLRRSTTASSSFLRDLVVNAIQGRLLKALARRPAVLVVRFEDLVSDTERVARTACSFVGLSFSESMLAQRFEQNTSFGEARRRGIGLAQKILSWGVRGVFAVMPLVVTRWLWKASRAFSPVAVIRGTYFTLLRDASHASPDGGPFHQPQPISARQDESPQS